MKLANTFPVVESTNQTQLMLDWHGERFGLKVLELVTLKLLYRKQPFSCCVDI